MADEVLNKIGLHELLEKEKMIDDDIILLQDDENTKVVTFRNLRDSLIDDEELPSQHRIWSSHMLDSKIKEFQTQLDFDIGKVEREIQEIIEKYATKEFVNIMIKEFAKTVPDIAEVEKVKKALESKRNITDPITCEDIESGEDSQKIRMKNLSYEVINAMVGTTPVTPPGVPEGGWVSEDIANEAINGSKLSKQYRYRGHYPDGDINRFTKDGLYLLGASVKNLPKYDENEEDEDRLLEVYNYGPDQYIVQIVHYTLDKGDKARPYYIRKARLSRLHIEDFVAHYDITEEFRITRNILVDNIFDAGIIDKGSVYDLTLDNNYLVKKGVKNLPNDKYDFTVSVKKYDSRIEYIARAIGYEHCEVYISNSYLNSSGIREISPWWQTNTVTKSKLQGKKLHLFGDGICFGMGSSNIPELSYPAILTNKYGLTIYNHALGDATIGVYGDEYLGERSVYKQIDNAEISNGDFAIIFAGGNDYKSGVAKIGLNADETDFSFKGALNMCIKRLMEKNPRIKVLVISPLFRARLDADDFRNSDETLINEMLLSDYVEAMEDISKYNHVPYLDLHSNGMVNKYNFTSYLSDRLYPNDEGHAMLAEKIFAALDFFY